MYEQFQPGHIVRGIDFTEDPLLQGRIYSYLDTQLNRHGGPNFEQLPINRPRVPIHNNNRDGAGQNFIPLNTAAYTPNTFNKGSPQQANQTVNNGFFTAPNRKVSGALNRALSPTFNDVWSQPRLFYNSLTPAEQQFLINAIRFETSHINSLTVKQNVLIQLNRVDHDLASRVAKALGIPAPDADPTHYHNNKSSFISIFNYSLPTVSTLKVGILASGNSSSSLSQAASLKASFNAAGVVGTIVGESLSTGVDTTYSSADASGFDGIVVTDGTDALFGKNATSTLFPQSRPSQILLDGYRWGKPVGSLGSGSAAFESAEINTSGQPGVFVQKANDVDKFVPLFEGGLKIFKFVDRFPLD
jgi:catalase